MVSGRVIRMAAVFGVAETDRIIAFAKRFPVFPCGADKRPLVQRGFHAATQESDQIRAWWRQWPDALVGVPTGQGTGLVVIDYDPDKATGATHAWIAEHADLLCSTRTHKTGRGGLHYLFSSKDRYQTGVDLVLDGSPRKGIDLRANGGYVIWWPFHTGDKPDGPFAPVPADLIDERRFSEKRDLAPLPATSSAEWRRERDRVESALTTLAPDGYEHWIRVGMALHHASGGSDEGFALWHEWSGRGESYDGIEDCRYHWASFGGYSGRALGLGTIYAAAKVAGWSAQRTMPEAPEVELPPIEAYADEAAVNEPAPHIQTEGHALIVAGRRMRWIDLEGKQPPTRTWLVNHWLTYGITLLAGRGGIGKSMIAQTVGTALVIGRPFIDEVAVPQTVLMWACEDDHDEVWRRQIAINQLLGCTMKDIEGRFIVESRLGCPNSMWTMAFGALTAGPALKEWHEQINDLGAGVAILDNIAHAFGGNENDRHHVTSFVNGLASVTERPLATLLLGHVARSQGSEFAGSAAWENAARMRWLFDVRLPDSKPDDGQEPEPDVRYLAKRKANYSTNDWRRFTYRDGVFAPDSAPGIAINYAAQSRKDDARRCVLSGLRKIVDSGLSATASTASPDYLPKLIVRMRLAEDYTQRELAEGMAALLIAGKLRNEVVGQYANRSPKKGLVEVQN
jgi:Bifunctional DNA primase/polymerase, N-terminal/AAA domain/Primase C terminal 2 (PriCT-2)